MSNKTIYYSFNNQKIVLTNLVSVSFYNEGIANRYNLLLTYKDSGLGYFDVINCSRLSSLTVGKDFKHVGEGGTLVTHLLTERACQLDAEDMKMCDYLFNGLTDYLNEEEELQLNFLTKIK